LVFQGDLLLVLLNCQLAQRVLRLTIIDRLLRRLIGEGLLAGHERRLVDDVQLLLQRLLSLLLGFDLLLGLQVQGLVRLFEALPRVGQGKPIVQDLGLRGHILPVAPVVETLGWVALWPLNLLLWCPHFILGDVG